MADPRYTIAVSNYNMEDTVQQSLESMLRQITDEYEIVVIDDSDDSSPRILEELSNKWPQLRVYTDCGNSNLAEAREKSFEKARGDYILESLDTDDEYKPVIEDFTTIYHAIEQTVEKPFYLSGQGMNMAPRSLLLEVPYRSVGYGEDRDLWRRLMARDAYIGIKHGDVAEQIGYHRDTWQLLQVGFETMAVQFQTGMSLLPYVRWAIAETLTGRNKPRHRAAAHILLAVPAYIKSLTLEEQYDAPQPFDDMSVWKRELRSRTMTLSELENEYNFRVDRNELSEAGRNAFDVDEAGFPL